MTSKAPRKIWTPEEDERLRALYPTMLNAALAIVFQCREQQVTSRAYRLDPPLYKDPEFLRQTWNEAARRRKVLGEKGGQFQPGQKPWNHGMKGWTNPGGERTQFKPGNLPQTWVPVGTRSTDDAGYWKEKIADPNVWRYCHRMIWEQHHGPIPPGGIVIFRNKNKDDLDIENLELIDRSEHCRRNSIHRYPAALKHVMHLTKKLNRMIEEKTDEHVHD
jgi:hypothetical protein